MCADLSVGTLPSVEVREADLIAFHLPMHTATRLAIPLIRRVRELNAEAHLCGYGLYAPLNEACLRESGVQSVIGGEFEGALCELADRLSPVSITSLDRLSFITPDRTRLPVLSRYPKLVTAEGRKLAGYTEASRGCKHLCRHCPVVPVYRGTFRIVPADVVLADIRQQVEAGAEHITFGDPDFLNGPGHARKLVEALHREFPAITYDITAKIEHLLARRDLLPVLRDTGCVFVTSAVEAVQDEVLAKLDKGHTRAGFIETAKLFREVGLILSPTFIPFTPWTTVHGFRELLEVVDELDLVENVASVQWSLRLLIPSGSRLLELSDIQRVIGDFDSSALVYPWRHPDSEVDALAERVSRVVRAGVAARESRPEIFAAVCEAASHARSYRLMPRTVIPFLEEPWFC